MMTSTGACSCVHGRPQAEEIVSATAKIPQRVASATIGSTRLDGNTVVMLRTSSTARAPVYEHLIKELGVRLIMLHPNVEAAKPHFSAIEHWIEHDLTDIDGMERKLRRLVVDDGPIHAICSFDEYGVFPAATLAGRFGLPSTPVSPAMLSTINIKSRFRDWCGRHGLTAPRYVAIRDPEEDAVEAARRLGLLFPIIAKPAPGAGSNLVQRADNEEELVRVVSRLWAGIEAMRPYAGHFEALGEPIHVLLEEFIDGEEVDVDAIVERGVVRFAAVSDNFETVAPFFSEVGGIAPSLLPPCKQDAFVRLLEQFVDSCSTDDTVGGLHGVLHFEAKFDTRRNAPVIIEVNCRMGSAETHSMIQTAFGVDLGEAFVRLALGLPVQPLPEVHQPGRAPASLNGTFAASANLYPDYAGSLISIDPPSPTVDAGFVRAMQFPVPPGTRVCPPPESSGCLLWLVGSGSSPGAAMASMNRLKQASNIRVRADEESQ